METRRVAGTEYLTAVRFIFRVDAAGASQTL